MDELALNPSELAEILGVEVEMGGDFQTEPPIPIAPAEKPAKRLPLRLDLPSLLRCNHRVQFPLLPIWICCLAFPSGSLLS